MIHMLIGAAARGLAVGAGVSAGATIAQKHLDNGASRCGRARSGTWCWCSCPTAITGGRVSACP
jgi:hypothetical protein